jgi:hypothetical protein
VCPGQQLTLYCCALQSMYWAGVPGDGGRYSHAGTGYLSTADHPFFAGPDTVSLPYLGEGQLPICKSQSAALVTTAACQGAGSGEATCNKLLVTLWGVLWLRRYVCAFSCFGYVVDSMWHMFDA